MKANSNPTLIVFVVFLLGFIAFVASHRAIAKFIPDDIQLAIVLVLLVWFAYWYFRRMMRLAFEDPNGTQNAEEDGAENAELLRHEESAYRVLGVDPKATGQEIRQAYRSLARQHHPDNFPEEEKAKASLRLTRIHRAYQIVGNADARFDYEMYVKSYWPDFPSLDEAYTYIQARRLLVSDVLEEVERKNSAAPANDLNKLSSPDDRDKDPVVSGSGDPPIQARNALPDANVSDVPTLPPSGRPNLSGECAACGEPYLIARGRSGPIHCERCGAELFRPES